MEFFEKWWDLYTVGSLQILTRFWETRNGISYWVTARSSVRNSFVFGLVWRIWQSLTASDTSCLTFYFMHCLWCLRTGWFSCFLFYCFGDENRKWMVAKFADRWRFYSAVQGITSTLCYEVSSGARISCCELCALNIPHRGEFLQALSSTWGIIQ